MPLIRANIVNPERRAKKPFLVVFLLQDLFFGGTQRHTLELVRRLDPSRFQAEIWLLMGGDDFVPLARSWDLPLTWLGRRRWVAPDSLVRLWWRLKTRPVDLLVLLTGVPNIWGRLLGRLTKVPLIVGTWRGTGCPRNNLEKWLWPWADHFLCNAEELQRIMMAHFKVPADRITVIHNGVDLDYFRPTAPPGPARRPVVLCVARLVPEKDHETLIAAFALVAARHPEAELWLVGDGPRRRALQHLAAMQLPAGRVRFIPGQADLRPLFGQSSLLVLSSVEEGLPNVVLEGMAAGLPVVATAVGGLAKVVQPGETGWLVPPKDVAALTGAISRLLADEAERRAFGRAGRARVEGRFSLTAMVKRHEEVFLRLLNARVSGRTPSAG
jgi:glycosyltransferase involved in cell wall biosynthesis